ncbi:MAG: hypothetical protein R3F24_14480 [Gammaproteobacteria bacterium]
MIAFTMSGENRTTRWVNSGWKSTMWKFFALLIVVWLGLMPPFFTEGACNAELKTESDRINADADTLTSSAVAVQYWKRRSIPQVLVSREQCLRVKPRYLTECGGGPLVYARIPVKNKICRIYRDDEIKVRLQFDYLDRLTHITAEMSPYKSLPIPFTGKTIHWAR